MANAPTATRDRALQLLSTGILPAQVAAACGVTESAISQYTADPDFAAELALLKYNALQKHNARDASYDSMEDRLLDQLERLLPLMMRPMEVLKALQVINGAKRRGAAAPESGAVQHNLVQIQMPTLIINKYTTKTNIQNQVIQAGDQELLTIQSGILLKQVKGEQDDELSKRASASLADNSSKSFTTEVTAG